jgi:PAS domain S-box-containing protein
LTLRKEITEQIKELLRQNPNGLSITAITQQVSINRNTAGRYLENLMVSGQVEMRHFGMAKIYRLAQRVPLSAMLSISSELIMLTDSSYRVIYANEPMLAFLSVTQKDLYGRNIEYTPCVTIFDEVFDLLKRRIKNAIEGKEWSGELPVRNGTIVFACRIAPAVFEEGQRGASILLEDITQRKLSEEAIRKSELEFRMLAENTFDIINRHRPDGMCLYVSPAIKKVSGFDPSEIIGHYGSEFIHPDDIRWIEETTRRMTAENPSCTVTYRTRHKDGHYIWAESSFQAVFHDRTGLITEIYGITRDITGRILAEEALRDSEDRYRKLVEISPDGIILHQDGRVVYMNPAALRLMRASCMEEIVGKEVLGIIHPDYREKVWGFIRKDLEGDMTPPIELLLLRLDGTTVPVEGRGVQTLVGGSPAVQVTIRDITDRKKTEERLRKSEEKYRFLAEASHDLIFIIDRNDTVEYVNSHAAVLLGKEPDSIIGERRSVYFPGDLGEGQADRLREVFETGRAVRSEGAIPVGGDVRWFDHSLIPVRDADNSVTAVLGVSRDITERRLTEEALRQSEATARGLINAPTDSVLLTDTDGVILDANETAIRKLGKRRADLIGTLADSALPEDVAKSRREIISEILAVKKPVRFEDNREGVWFDTVAYPILNRTGEVTRIAIIARDITERKNTEEALARSEERFRDLITTTPDIVWEADDRACFVYVSPQVEQILGYRPEELVGRSPFEFMDPAQRTRTRETYDGVVWERGDFVANDSYWLHKDGHTVVLESRARAIYRQDGSFAGFHGIDRDVTEHRQTEEALKGLVRAFRLIAENAGDIISRIQPDGTCMYISPAVRWILGYEPEDMIGRPGFEYLHPADLPHLLEVVRTYEKSGANTGSDRFRMRHKDGSYIWLEATIRAIRDEKTGKIREFTMVSRPTGERDFS